MPVTLEQYGLDQLSMEDRWELLELLESSLNQAPTPIPEWHLRILEERIAVADANPGAGIPLEEFKAKFLGKS